MKFSLNGDKKAKKEFRDRVAIGGHTGAQIEKKQQTQLPRAGRQSANNKSCQRNLLNV